MKKYLIIFGALALIVAGCSATSSNITNSGVILPLDPLSYSWEDINIEAGDVERGFHFRNDSEEPLLLTGLSTSCMCTTAYIELPDGSISPEFGMHGNPKWNYEVAPGEEFEVEVTFDPMAHGPNAVGPIKRQVFLTSSSPSGPVAMDVEANVMYAKDYQEKYADQPFVFSEVEHDFGVIKQSDPIASKEFKFKYVGDAPVKVTGVPTSCACTSAEISGEVFENGYEGILTVYFDPNLHEEPKGKFFKTVSILTEPKLKKQPEVKIWAEIDLDLGPDAYKLKEAHKD